MLFQCVTVLMMVMECVQRMRCASIAIVCQKVLRFFLNSIELINCVYINIISASQCRCGIERPDTYRDFNRVIGGKEVTKV